MKNKLIPLILASMAVGALAACGGTTPATPKGLPNEYSLMEHWSVNAEEQYYTINQDENGLEVSYANVNEYRFIKRSFAYDGKDAKKFNQYKKLMFTGSLTTDNDDTRNVLVKFESASFVREVAFTFKAAVETYELKLDGYDWDALSSGTLMFFVNAGGATAASGTMSLSKICLSKEELDPTHQNLAPQEHDKFAGADELHAMTDWRANNTKNIVVAPENGAYKITWGGKGEWENAIAFVDNDGANTMQASGYKRVQFTLSGTVGRKALCKVELHNAAGANVGAVEQAVDFDNAEDKVVAIDVEALLQTADATTVWLLVFPDQGTFGNAEVQGEIMLKDVLLDKTAVPKPVIPTNVASYQHFYLEEAKYKAFDYTVENHVSTWTFENLPADWGNNFQYIAKLHGDIEWANPADYTHFHGVFTASVELRILIKPYDSGAAQQFFTLPAGEETVIDFDVDSSIVNFNSATCIFINPQDSDWGTKTGTLVGKDLMMARAGLSYYKTGDEYVRVNKFGAATQGNYTLGNDANQDLTLAFSKSEVGYDAAELFVSHGDKQWNHISVTVKSDVACKMIFKSPSQEVRQDLVVGDNVLDFDIGPTNDVWGNIKLMVGIPEGDAVLTGNLTFVNFRLTHVAA